jgi:hypothetical protein
VFGRWRWARRIFVGDFWFRIGFCSAFGLQLKVKLRFKLESCVSAWRLRFPRSRRFAEKLQALAPSDKV